MGLTEFYEERLSNSATLYQDQKRNDRKRRPELRNARFISSRAYLSFENRSGSVFSLVIIPPRV